MQTENIYSINNYLNSRQLKLFDFGLSKQKTPSLLQLSKIEKVDLTGNIMLDFVLTAYNYAKIKFNKYSSIYSKQKYTLPQLFAILAYKTYNKYDYIRKEEITSWQNHTSKRKRPIKKQSADICAPGRHWR